MRVRNQSKRSPGAEVYGSPSSVHPPQPASNSPNCRSGIGSPRRGDWYGQAIILVSRRVSNVTPASSISTLAPASVRTFAAMPPPAPEPTITTS
jgi:hypothetical protein